MRALLADHPSDAVGAFLAFMNSVHEWYRQPRAEVEPIASHVQDLLDAGHHLRAEATLWVLETALAERHSTTALQVVGLVDDLLAERAALGLADPVSVRLRTARADVSGQWEDLLRDARAGRLSAFNATLVHARFGRFTARDGRPEDAEAEYSAAIQRACTAGIGAEASAGVRSICRVRMRYGTLLESPNDLLQVAIDIDGGGSIGLIPGRDPLDLGSASFADGKLPEALRWYRVALRRGIIRGDLNAEEAAQGALALVLRRAGEPAAALPYALAAGDPKGAEECLPLSGAIDLRPRLSELPYWERATALVVAARQADLVPDGEVGYYIDTALIAIDERERSFFGPQVGPQGWKVLAAFIERADEMQASEALARLSGLVERAPNTYRPNDDQHVAIVVGVLRAFPSLAEQATSHLVQIVAVGDDFAQTARKEVLQRLEPPPDALVQLLEPLASEGNPTALALMEDLEAPHPDSVASATAAVEALLSAEPPPAGTYRMGTGLARVAWRARLLEPEIRRRVANYCADLAEDADRIEQNRTEGAEGLFALARYLPDDLRSSYFSRMITLARNGADPTELDGFLAGSLHPLSNVRIDLDSGSLAREALDTAARLAVTATEAAEVLDLATAGLFSGDDKVVYASSHAISHLDPSHVTINPGLLRSHPSRWARQLAAVVAAAGTPPQVDLLEQLAVDPDVSVRRSLASSLTRLAASPELALSIAGRLASDPDWSVRDIVARLDLDTVAGPDGADPPPGQTA